MAEPEQDGQDDHHDGVQYGARDYDPKTGRWTSKDASRFGGGANFYAYANTDPINEVDLSGRDPLVIAGAAIGFFGDLGYQLATNGGNLSCVDWKQVGIATGIGAMAGLIGPLAFDEAFLAEEAGGVGTPLKVIGRLADTAAYRGNPAFEVIADSPWSPAINQAWIQGAIDAQEPFLVASPLTEANILNPGNASGLTVFADEISQLLGAGYQWAGNMLVPPI